MRTLLSILVAVIALSSVWAQSNRRRITPLDTPATATQAINEAADDTARINARRRARSVEYTDERGRIMYVDTITGQEWTDSTTIKTIPHMEYPLFHAASIGINIWDPVMRIFGQDYGLASAWAELSLHNRYGIIVEAGMGAASHRGPADNYLYRSPASVFFKLGANYNFFFNSNPDYALYAGVRYGLSPFSYSVDDVNLPSDYWQQTAHFAVPSQQATAGWFEVGLGLRVKLAGPISAGWEVKYHSLAHCTKGRYGDPWYIPGFGTRGSSITGSFSIVYTLSLSHLNKKASRAVIEESNAVEGVLPAQ